MHRITALALGVLLCGAVVLVGNRPAAGDKPEDQAKAVAAARDRGLDWLTKNQAADGSWGKTYTFAVTSFACLSYLSVSDEPYTGDRGDVLVKGLKFLLAHQKDGVFDPQGHSWIHG